jgi:hypothetical protein
MKKTFFLILFSAASMMLFAQQHRYNRRQSVPEEVQRSYQKDYRNYDNNPTWDMQNNQWHTRYMDREHNNRYVDVYYDRYGRRLQSQSQWDRNDLPFRVRERIRNRYRDENYAVYRIERPRRRIFFQIVFGNGDRRIYLDERGREVRYY